MKPLLIVCLLAAVGLVQAVTHQLDSDEDSSPPASLKRPVYGTVPVQRLSESQSAQAVQVDAVEQRFEEPEIDSTIPRNVRYSSTGGYGYNNNGYGWSGTSQGGYSSGGTVCTVCPSYDAHRCCALGYRQCCNVRVPTTHHHSHSHQIGGAGFTYISPPSVYTSSAIGEKAGQCRTYSNFGHTHGTGGYVNQNAGYYSTRREDQGDIVRSKRDAPIGTYQAYGPPYYGGGGYSSGGHQGYSSGWNTGGQHGGNGLPPSPTYGTNYCRRDYDCPGIEKCCSGFCSNPVAVVIG